MLHLDPKKRISATEALKHPYFHSVPLPTDPADFPDYHGDFHEYTVRKDKSIVQNAQREEKQKQVVNSRPIGNQDGAYEENRVGGKRPRSRGLHHPVSHKYTKPPHHSYNHKSSYHKNAGHEKYSKPYEKSSDLQLAGMKRNHSHMEVSKPKDADSRSKLFTAAKGSNLKEPINSRLLSLLPKEEQDAIMADESCSSQEPTMVPKTKLMEQLSSMKRRDLKSDQKDQGKE